MAAPVAAPVTAPVATLVVALVAAPVAALVAALVAASQLGPGNDRGRGSPTAPSRMLFRAVCRELTLRVEVRAAAERRLAGASACELHRAGRDGRK